MRVLRAGVPTFGIVAFLLASLFFAVSLMPSLVPRPTVVQGVLSGISLAAGWGLGSALAWLFGVAGLPGLRGAAGQWLARVALVAGLAGAVWSLWRASDWQDGVRALMGMTPVEGGRPILVALVALLVGWVLVATVRLAAALAGRFRLWLSYRLPDRQAGVLAVLLTALLFWAVGDGLLVRGAMRAADASYRAYDAVLEEASPRPTDPARAGGPGSLIDWEGMGRAGREMIAAGPDAAAIAAAMGAPARDPLRVYVGLNSADDPQARAALALAEMIRLGAFDRAAVVIVTPTGTGWIDPESQAALEYVLGGDVATVAVQYSYLASWIALLADPDYGVETARAVFAAVHGHWRALPRDRRPKLYLHGLSLGALYTDLSHDPVQVIADPHDGALLSGPPFGSPTWRAVTAARNADTPAWLPAFRDGSVVRFTAQDNRLDDAAAPWSNFRLIYLQYASDAVVFFDPDAWWRPPAWMAHPRGPDVSPDMRWLPVVTQLQLGVDIMMAVVPPMGHGHVYAFPHYLDAWASLTDAPGWTPERLAQLREMAR